MQKASLPDVGDIKAVQQQRHLAACWWWGNFITFGNFGGFFKSLKLKKPKEFGITSFFTYGNFGVFF